jgi:AcrR family transcriptional regulator
MRDIAAAARLPLATAVYHFARKEQLYAAVLEAIGAELVRELVGATAGDDPPARVDAFARALVRWSIDHPGRVRLLLRELLDNPARVARAGKLPLAPVLAEAAALVGAGAQLGGSPELAVLHVVGAVSYTVAAQPTVARIVGPARAARLAGAYEDEAIAFARRALGLPPANPANPAPPQPPAPSPLPPPPPSPTAAKETRHAASPPGRARPPRARAPRAPDDRRRARAVDAPRGRVRRRGAPRARVAAAVP